MTKNVGTIDRIVRAGVAVGALWAASAVGFASLGGILLLVLAVAMAVTAAVGVCPLYLPFGISTCPAPKA